MACFWGIARTIFAASVVGFVLGFGVAQAQTPPARKCVAAPAPGTSATVATPSAGAATAPPAAAASVGGSYEATIEGIGPGRATLCATLPSLTDKVMLQVPTRDLQGGLARARPGDIAKIEVDDAVHPTRVTKVTEIDRPVDEASRLWAMAISAIGLAAILSLLTGFKPQTLLIGVDKRYSNSQVQFALWFGAVAIVYAAAVGLRISVLGGDFIGGVGLPQNLIVLTGLSAFTFGGAKMISAQKVASAATAQANITAQGAADQAEAVNAANDVHNASLPATSPPTTPVAIVSPIGVKTVSDKGSGIGRLIPDLMQNDHGDADLGDVQMIITAVAAVVLFMAAAFHFLGRLAISSQIMLPDVDTALLSIFGLGQGAYLVKKAALPLGQG